MTKRLSGKTVLISGSNGRLGKSFCRAVIDEGGFAILLDIVEDQEFLSSLNGDKFLFLKGSTTSTEDVDKVLEEGNKRFSTIDGVVHAAYPRSKGWGTKFEELEAKFLFQDLSDQLGGAILFSQRVLKFFEKQGHGNLIHISSIQGIATPKFEHYKGTQMVSPIEYSCIKSGIIALTRYLAKYYRSQNIRINCLSLGGIRDAQPQGFLDKYRQSCNSKGMLDGEDLNGAILFLLSDESKFYTGQNLIIDDGWSL